MGNILFSVETQTTEERTQLYHAEIDALYKDLTAKGKILILSAELGVRLFKELLIPWKSLLCFYTLFNCPCSNTFWQTSLIKLLKPNCNKNYKKLLQFCYFNICCALPAVLESVQAISQYRSVLLFFSDFSHVFVLTFVITPTSTI